MANNVGFKRGPHAQLPVSGAIEGVFYLTTDTERFYVGKKDGTLAELNKSIRSVKDTDSLPDITSANVAIGDFYYIINGNILAVCVSDSNLESGKKWIQINPDTDTDTKIYSTTFSVATEEDITTITQTTKLADKNGNVLTGQDKISSFKIKNGNGVKVTSSNNEITLNGDYGFNITNEGSNKVDINLMAGEEEQDDFAIVGGDNITIAINNDTDPETSAITKKKISITAKDTIIKSAKQILTSDGAIDIELEDQDGNIVDHIASDPIAYRIGENSYIPGSELPVYTKDEINSKLNKINGLNYKGTVGSGGSVGDTLPTENVSIGDMYLVVGDGTVVGSGISGKKGDYFIATGTENIEGIITSDLVWTYMPAGSNSGGSGTDTTYSTEADTTNHALNLKDDRGTITGGIDLDAEGAIELSSTSSSFGKILKTKIKHANIVRNDPDAIEPNSSNTKTIVTGVITNEQGHVTAVKTATVDGVTLRGYSLSGEETITSNKITTKHKLSTGDGTDKGTITSTISSSSLTFSKVVGEDSGKNAGYSIDLEWGTF